MTPVPTPSVTPVFASEEEALAAAEESYKRYLRVSDAIAAEGGTHPERLSPYVTPEELRRANEDFGSLQSATRHMQGESKFDSLTLQRQDAQEIVVYLCLDVSEVRVIDAGGSDVTPASRVDRVPLEVAFALDGSELLLDSSDVWDGENFC